MISMARQIQGNVGNKTKTITWLSLTKDFDSINSEAFWKVLSTFGYPITFFQF